MDKENLLECLNHEKDNIDQMPGWSADLLIETIAYIEQAPESSLSSDGLEGLQPTEEQIIMAAKMYRCDFDERSDEEQVWLKGIASNWLICWQRSFKKKAD